MAPEAEGSAIELRGDYQQIVNRHTSDEDGTDWRGVTQEAWTNPELRDQPAVAAEQFIGSGMSLEDMDEMIDDAEGGWLGMGADDPGHLAWLRKVKQAMMGDERHEVGNSAPSGQADPNLEGKEFVEQSPWRRWIRDL
jgi:hypothetical protein